MQSAARQARASGRASQGHPAERRFGKPSAGRAPGLLRLAFPAFPAAPRPTPTGREFSGQRARGAHREPSASPGSTSAGGRGGKTARPRVLRRPAGPGATARARLRARRPLSGFLGAVRGRGRGMRGGVGASRAGGGSAGRGRGRAARAALGPLGQ